MNCHEYVRDFGFRIDASERPFRKASLQPHLVALRWNRRFLLKWGTYLRAPEHCFALLPYQGRVHTLQLY